MLKPSIGFKETQAVIMGSSKYHYPLLVVISGPSGVGKDTIIRKMKERRLPFHFIVTATTRLPRENEINGRDYFFFSKDEFIRMIQQNELLEHSIVYGDYKGIPKQQVRNALTSGLDVVVRIDVQGAQKVRKIEPNIVSIFIAPESEESLFLRLKTRNSESPESLELRMATAHDELKRKHEFAYCVINRNMAIDNTVDEIVSIIQAEHSRASPRKINL